MLAMWFQETYTFSSTNAILLTIFVGLVALSMVAQAIVALRAAKTVREMAATVEELKHKALPLIATAGSVAKSVEGILAENTPKIRVITENVVEATTVLRATAKQVRESAQQVEKTVADANMRTQRQVARVDGMVTAALATTAEIAETIERGIKVPAQRIAMMATQTKLVVEGVLSKVRVLAAKAPSLDAKDGRR